jgi:hypothetical protein
MTNFSLVFPTGIRVMQIILTSLSIWVSLKILRHTFPFFKGALILGGMSLIFNGAHPGIQFLITVLCHTFGMKDMLFIMNTTALVEIILGIILSAVLFWKWFKIPLVKSLIVTALSTIIASIIVFIVANLYLDQIVRWDEGGSGG